jgi:hypothetical protein
VAVDADAIAAHAIDAIAATSAIAAIDAAHAIDAIAATDAIDAIPVELN